MQGHSRVVHVKQSSGRHAKRPTRDQEAAHVAFLDKGTTVRPCVWGGGGVRKSARPWVSHPTHAYGQGSLPLDMSTE